MTPVIPESHPPSPAIEADRVQKLFGRVEAVRGVTLSISRGELFGLLGPDGAGKTTIIEILCGAQKPTAGRIRILGRDPVRGRASLRGRIGYMSEEFSLYEDLTVEENIDFFADLYRVPDDERQKRKRELLRFSRLSPFVHRLARQLSGGMRKKLALCCVLIYRPQVLLLDEPTTGIDPVSRREFWELVYSFWVQGMTIFVSTPYMDEAERFQRVALMYEGEIIACGSPDQLKADANIDILDVVASAPRDLLRRLRGHSAFLGAALRGDHLHLRVTSAEEGKRALGALMRAHGIELKEVRAITPSLEDAFMTAVDVRQRRAPTDTGGEGASPIPANMPFERREKAPDPAIEAFELTRRFGAFIAVDRLHLRIASGEIFGFLGANGAGKTTTIKMLCGILPPTSGRARVAGCDVFRETDRVKPRIGYVSQLFSLYRDLTVKENLELYADLYDVPRSQIAERQRWVLRMADLSGREDVLARDLAIGWRQRLALGCAILHQPEILFLDEPTSGVDPLSRRKFWDLIYALSDLGMTIFVTTHYVDEAEHCDRVGFMHAGRLIAAGSPSEMKRRLIEGVVIEIEVNEPMRAQRVLTAAGNFRQVALFGKKLHVHADDVAAASQEARERLLRAGISVGDVRPILASLEDAFMAAIERAESSSARSGESSGK
ncbi:MAG: ABC transporter ATP-binding protein [Acidobacteria bacterium]|nr:MAG: ABC transporter ATP-binding protein [Acidobacteriota bacterium]